MLKGNHARAGTQRLRWTLLIKVWQNVERVASRGARVE
jgi:hypothetical protein